jgi:hypothetical protein
MTMPALRRLCPRCGRWWTIDDPLFVTCPGCRLYDTDPTHGGCSRFGWKGPFNWEEHLAQRRARRGLTPNPSDENAAKVIEEGRG